MNSILYGLTNSSMMDYKYLYCTAFCWYQKSWSNLLWHVTFNLQLVSKVSPFFDHITTFEMPYLWTSIKGSVHTCSTDVWISNKSAKLVWALRLREVQQYGLQWNQIMQKINLRFLHGTATNIWLRHIGEVVAVSTNIAISDKKVLVY